MGASGSKAAREGVRRFPTRAPGSTPPSTVTRATRERAAAAAAAATRPRPQASSTKEDAVRAGSIDPTGGQSVDPAFADRLRRMGVAQPNPTFSPSSTAGIFSDAASATPSSVSAPQFPPAPSNATLNVLEARRQLQARAEQEFGDMGRPGSEGRELLDIGTIRKILVLRQQGELAAEIESKLRLKPGVVARLGSEGVVSPL